MKAYSLFQSFGSQGFMKPLKSVLGASLRFVCSPHIDSMKV